MAVHSQACPLYWGWGSRTVYSRYGQWVAPSCVSVPTAVPPRAPRAAAASGRGWALYTRDHGWCGSGHPQAEGRVGLPFCGELLGVFSMPHHEAEFSRAAATEALLPHASASPGGKVYKKLRLSLRLPRNAQLLSERVVTSFWFPPSLHHPGLPLLQALAPFP